MKCETCGWDHFLPRPEYETSDSKGLVGKYDLKESKEKLASWADFCEWKYEFLNCRNYRDLEDYEKIGLLIVFLKERGLRSWDMPNINFMSLEILEDKVKSLPPKDNEVEKLAERLMGLNYGPDTINKFKHMARVAIEVIRGEK